MDEEEEDEADEEEADEEEADEEVEERLKEEERLSRTVHFYLSGGGSAAALFCLYGCFSVAFLALFLY